MKRNEEAETWPLQFLVDQAGLDPWFIGNRGGRCIGMRPSMAYGVHREKIRGLLQECGLKEARLFGSVYRGEDVSGSDLDILINPHFDGVPSLVVFELSRNLEKLLGVKVDLRTHEEFFPSALADILKNSSLI